MAADTPGKKESWREKYRMDKTAFRAYNMEEHGNIGMGYWKTKTVEERLEASIILIEAAYGIENFLDHPVDKSVFTVRRREG